MSNLPVAEHREVPLPSRPSAGDRRLVGLEQRVLARYRRLRLPADAPVVVGFSGGEDSLALAALLGRIASLARFRPILCHVDHCLRPESGEEQQRAARLATALGLPFRALRVGDDPRRSHPGVGLEEAARRERYRLLAAVVAEAKAALLALAHHQADQAETVLLHLLRGTGLAGAAGMAERAHLLVPWWGPGGAGTRLPLWRPFLSEPRTEVRRYGGCLGLEAIQDPSNDEAAARRNELRHRVMPLLEQISPGATAALGRYAAIAAADDAALDALVDARYGAAVRADGSLGRAEMKGETVAVRRRIVRRWLWESTGCAVPSLDRVEAVLALLASGSRSARIEVGAGCAVVGVGDRVRVEGRPGGEEERGWVESSQDNGVTPGSAGWRAS